MESTLRTFNNESGPFDDIHFMKSAQRPVTYSNYCAVNDRKYKNDRVQDSLCFKFCQISTSLRNKYIIIYCLPLLFFLFVCLKFHFVK